MTDKVDYLTRDEVIIIHEEILKMSPARKGLRDLGLLESSLFRPQSGYYPTLYLQAAALFQSLLLNHAFVDGNKRTAFMCLIIFLRINQKKLIAKDKEVIFFIIEKIIKQGAPVEEIALWIEKHTH